MSRFRSKPPSEEERALFEEAMKDATPLNKRVRHAPSPAKAIRIQPQQIPARPVFTENPAPMIRGHAEAHLRRGRLEPDSRLDLHGMTQEAAYRAVVRFLFRAQSEGQRLVLVITGKGGVLRGQLALWLGQAELTPVVAGLSEAHIKHGGSGAFYVYLRQTRR
jgi:DNA-nicking Smr family endonuclease